MDTEDKFNRRLEKIKHHLTKQKATADEIKRLFDENARHLIRHDQAAYLERLQAEIRKALEIMREQEADEKSNFDLQVLHGAIPSMVSDLFSAFKSRTNPSGKDQFEYVKTMFGNPTFNRVIITIGPEGVPCGVEVVSISKKARQSRTSERSVIDNLQNDGLLLVEPTIFDKLLAYFKKAILDGNASFPINLELVIQTFNVIESPPNKEI